MPKITDLKASDLMEEEFVKVRPTLTIDKVAEEMRELKARCAVVVEDSKPVGIVTESDIIDKIVSKDKRPAEAEVKEIMSSPVLTVEPDESATEVGRLMIEKNKHQFPVAEEGKIKGIIYPKNIAKVSPEIVGILEEKLKRIRSETMSRSKEETFPGYCEQCGNWSSDLKEVGGRMLCGECRR